MDSENSRNAPKLLQSKNGFAERVGNALFCFGGEFYCGDGVRNGSMNRDEDIARCGIELSEVNSDGANEVRVSRAMLWSSHAR